MGEKNMLDRPRGSGLRDRPVSTLIPRLLAGRDRLSRPEKEQVLGEVLAEVAPARRRWWLATVPALAAAAIAVLVISTRTPQGELTTRGELTARGSAGTFAAFEPRCAGACSRGDKVLFDLEGTTGYRYFAAFARRSDGTIVWLIPASVEIAVHTTKGVLDRAAVLDAPGSYAVYGVFSAEPLTQDEIRAELDEHALTAGPGTRVVVQELAVR